MLKRQIYILFALILTLLFRESCSSQDLIQISRCCNTPQFIKINIDTSLADGPKSSTVSVSPSGEIVEGSSVTLTCSTDANPAANYTWYKENQTLHQGPEDIYHFTSISSEDRGSYYCKSENQYKQITSSALLLDVQCKWKTSASHLDTDLMVVGM